MMRLTFLLLDLENGPQEDQPSSAPYINFLFRFSRKLLKILIHKCTQALYWKVSTSSPEMTASTTSGRLQIAFMPPLPSPTIYLHKWSFWKIWISTKASISKMYHHIAPDSPYILPENDVTIYKRVNFGSCSGRDFLIMP